jgi:acetyl esterase
MGILKMIGFIRNGLLTTLCSITFSLTFADEPTIVKLTSPSISSESGSATSNELDPATVSFLDEFSKIFASIEDLSIPEQRETIKEMFRVPKSQLESIEKIEDKVLPGRHGSINVRLFSPKNEDQLPVIIYFHRGGWVYGSIEESEVICRRLANETGSIVAAVEYRLSPEHKFPIPLEDCYDATKWIFENSPTFLGDPNKVILCGESAGGNLAAAVSLMMLKTKQFSIAGQLLIYPVLTSDLEQKHYDNSPDKSLLSYGNMQFFWNMYLSSPEDGENPFASPLKNKNFANLPSCFIVTAEHDALKHEGACYGESLQMAGVTVQVKNYPGVIHGFLDLPLADTIKKEAIKDIATWVKKL